MKRWDWMSLRPTLNGAPLTSSRERAAHFWHWTRGQGEPGFVVPDPDGGAPLTPAQVNADDIEVPAPGHHIG